jgi:hypothetical protein
MGEGAEMESGGNPPQSCLIPARKPVWNREDLEDRGLQMCVNCSSILPWGPEMFLSFVAMLRSLSAATFCASFLLCLLALRIRRILAFAGVYVYYCTILWAFSLCVWCGVSVYFGWGLFLLIVGVFFGGVGVVPVAFLCFLFGGKWRELFELLLQFGLVFAGNLVAPWMLDRAFQLERSQPAADAGIRGRLEMPRWQESRPRQ